MDEEFDLTYDYKFIVKREKLCKSIIDASEEMIINREKMEESLSASLEKAKSDNDEFKIKRFSRELNDLRDTKEPAIKELAEYKQKLLDIYDEEDNVLRRLSENNIDIGNVKYQAIYGDDE
ncbi:hypothetical protein HW41_03205 [Apilactobacillus kunkeei]|uniref:hypothetical protein n=1 Tax=Apilactobacillus kunkeei TaxID=148814 RepID=UPI00059AE121|nr:hypothetical protein [Apilactobacillus kunkeei]KIM18788.1 hypothetical protein HW41_03205 [Apilactobacillus kunkeei]MBI0092042.1 hypothetical protein [Lactobacillus sp. M0345]CAI2555679.1 hypothetical protein AKUH4B402J_01230 [Apilactobacillus kunkeei]